jgi:hypothetical protein
MSLPVLFCQLVAINRNLVDEFLYKLATAMIGGKIDFDELFPCIHE